MLFNCQFAMSIPTPLLAPTLKKREKKEEHTEINMNKHC